MTLPPPEEQTIHSLETKDGETLFADADIRAVTKWWKKNREGKPGVFLKRTEQKTYYQQWLWGE